MSLRPIFSLCALGFLVACNDIDELEAEVASLQATLAKAESTMERMSVERAIQLARVSARDNELLIPAEGGRYDLRRGSVKSLERVSGVTPGGAVIVNIRGDIKVPPDKVGSQPDGVHELIKETMSTQSVAQRWNGSLLRILAPIRFFSQGGPAQVVGGVYMEYEPTEFVSEVGSAITR
jgi:hypothetical protein